MMKDAIHRFKKLNEIKQNEYQNIHNLTYNSETVEHQKQGQDRKRKNSKSFYEVNNILTQRFGRGVCVCMCMYVCMCVCVCVCVYNIFYFVIYIIHNKIEAKSLCKLLVNQIQACLKMIILNDQVEFISGMQGWFNIRKINQWNSPHRRIKEKII